MFWMVSAAGFFSGRPYGPSGEEPFMRENGFSNDGLVHTETGSGDHILHYTATCVDEGKAPRK